MDKLLESFKAYLKGIPRNKLYLYLMLLVTVIGGSVIGLSFLQKDEYQPLFAGLTTEDASMVVARLKEQKIPYKLGAAATHRFGAEGKGLRRKAGARLPERASRRRRDGLELFDKTNYGMTEFMQNVNYKRAIQGELTRTINQMPEVKASRVHIAIPEKSLFTEKEKRGNRLYVPQAEVRAGSFPGSRWPASSRLVAGSIEGLKPENVVVIDSSGKRPP